MKKNSELNNNTNNFKTFLKKKNIEISIQRYLIEAMGSMAVGLFASLLIGTILNTIGLRLNIIFLSEVIWPIAREMTGAAIGVAVAYSLKAPPLVLFSSVITGTAGNVLGGPAGAFIASLIGSEFGKLVSKETKIDIIVTPGTTIIVGVFIGSVIGPVIGSFMTFTGDLIMYATTLRPLLMGVLISVVVGMVLTLPISSAALCMMLGLSGLAGGAATAGCCAQMIGFAVMSYKENGWGGIVAQGIGTSMLQVPNIIRNWRIWIPPTLVSAVTGPLATVVLKMENSPMGAGMGTSGFVGLIETISTMESAGKGGVTMWMGMLLLYILIPATLTPIISNYMRKQNWIKDGDLKLDL